MKADYPKRGCLYLISGASQNKKTDEFKSSGHSEEVFWVVTDNSQGL